MYNQFRGEAQYGDFLRQGLEHEAGAPMPPPPPTQNSDMAFDSQMDRRVDEIEGMKQRLMADAKKQR